jgi:hypothetical protein
MSYNSSYTIKKILRLQEKPTVFKKTFQNIKLTSTFLFRGAFGYLLNPDPQNPLNLDKDPKHCP